MQNDQPYSLVIPEIFRRERMQAFLMAALIVLLYVPAVGGGFITDDALLSYGNPAMRSLDGLRRLWLGSGTPDYFPLTSTTFWIDVQLWGQNAAGYRLENILLHAGSALLVWRILRLLRVPGAWLGGLLFGIHPLAVTSVAWIAERKNTLSQLFFLLSLFAYLRFDADGRRRWYAAALGAFLLALLAKSSVVMLPVLLLLLLCWRHGGWRWGDAWRTIPFFVLSLVLGLVTVHFQLQQDKVVAAIPYYLSDFFTRLAISGQALWFYLRQSLFPCNITLIYPRWKVNPYQWSVYLPTLAWGVLLAAAWFARCRAAWCLAIWLLLAAGTLLLLPVLSFVNMAFHQLSWVSDHLAYLALPVVTAGVAAGITVLLRSPQKTRRWAGGGLLILMLGWWGVQAAGRARTHGNTEALWEDLIQKNKECWVGYDELASCKLRPVWDNYLQHRPVTPDRAVITEAERLALAGLRLRRHPLLFELAGMCRELQGDRDGAVRCYQQSVMLDPEKSRGWFHLGWIAEQEGRLQEAERNYRKRLEIDSGEENTLVNLGNVLSAQERLEEALSEYAKARKIAPKVPDAYINACEVLLRLGRITEADALARDALRRLPDDAGVRLTVGTLALRQGRLREAGEHLRRAAELSPTMPDVFINLGIVQASDGNPQAALDSWKQAATLNPTDPTPHRLAAKALTALGRLEQAQAEARKATEVTVK